MPSLSKTDCEKYDADGFVSILQAIDGRTVDLMIETWQELWNGIDLEDAPPFVHWRDREDGVRVADRLDPVQNLSQAFRDVCNIPSLRLPAEQLLGGPVFVMKDKLITKNPGTTGYGAHQDMPYWENSGVPADEVLSVAIALDEITLAHGPLELFSGWHHTRLTTDESDLDLDHTALNKIGKGYSATMTAGDAVFFHALTPHRSSTNRAKSPRRIYMITYARDHGNTEDVVRKYRAGLAHTHTTHLKHKI